MDYFLYRGDELFAEDVPLRIIAAEIGTPCYVYSRATLLRHWRAFDRAFAPHPHLVCYSVKANSNLAVLNTLVQLDSGFDVVSGGELERVLRAGGAAEKIVFSGVGKAVWEIRRALEVGVLCLNIESAAELRRIQEIAADLDCRAPVAVRINPDVDPRTHPYIATGLRETKFGIPIDQARQVYREARDMPNIDIKGVACHIGSQLTETAPHRDALRRVLAFVDELRDLGIALEHIDVGGGLGVRYTDEQPPLPDAYARALLAVMAEHGCELPLHIEPGRAIAGNAGVLLTRVEYLKHGSPKNFAVVDAAMNDLLRPTLYQARQEIVPVNQGAQVESRCYDVVGPICETADYLGHDRDLAIAPDDLLAVRTAGAYGAVMSSNYNARRRAAEVLVDGDRYFVVRRRESIDHMLAGESIPPV